MTSPCTNQPHFPDCKSYSKALNPLQPTLKMFLFPLVRSESVAQELGSRTDFKSIGWAREKARPGDTCFGVTTCSQNIPRAGLPRLAPNPLCWEGWAGRGAKLKVG